MVRKLKSDAMETQPVDRPSEVATPMARGPSNRSHGTPASADIADPGGDDEKARPEEAAKLAGRVTVETVATRIRLSGCSLVVASKRDQRHLRCDPFVRRDNPKALARKGWVQSQGLGRDASYRFTAGNLKSAGAGFQSLLSRGRSPQKTQHPNLIDCVHRCTVILMSGIRQQAP
jgi:hypothetical protein